MRVLKLQIVSKRCRKYRTRSHYTKAGKKITESASTKTVEMVLCKIHFYEVQRLLNLYSLHDMSFELNKLWISLPEVPVTDTKSDDDSKKTKTKKGHDPGDEL